MTYIRDPGSSAIYMYICVYIYIYIYKAQLEHSFLAASNVFVVDTTVHNDGLLTSDGLTRISAITQFLDQFLCYSSTIHLLLASEFIVLQDRSTHRTLKLFKDPLNSCSRSIDVLSTKVVLRQLRWINSTRFNIG